MTAGQQTQVANRQLVQLLSAWFQSRREASFAWSRAVSEYLALPALRGFWPMSSVDYAAASRARDLSGQGYHLTDNNTPTFGFDNLAPYVDFVAASSQWLSRIDGGAANWADVRGNEAYVVSGQRGLTFGGWFKPDVVTTGYLMSKGGVAPNRAYDLLFLGGGTSRFQLSVDGTAIVSVDSGAVSVGNWHHIVARFIPSTSRDIFLDGVEANNNVPATPATIWDSTGPFNIGARNGATYYDGKASMCFLCAAALSDAIILSLFEQTKAMFGVN